MNRLPMSLLILAGLTGSCLCSQAELVTFNLDPALSSITITGSTLQATMQEQGAGSLRTSFTGSLKAEVTANSIQFITGSSIDARTNGVWSPLGNGGNGSAPADFAARATVAGSTALAALRNIVLDASSPVIPLGAGGFDSSSLIFEFPASGTASLDYRVSGGLFSTSGSERLETRATNNVSTAATLVNQGGTQTLTIPVRATFVFDLVSTGDTIVTLMGSLVAVSAATPVVVFNSGSITVNGSFLGLQWQAAAGQTFRIESSTNLVNWTTRASNITSANTAYSWSGSPIGPIEYFRLAQ